MGYTHYWYGNRPFTAAEWMNIQSDAHKLLNPQPIKVLLEYDQPGTVPEIANDVIAFNGDGDEGHETFWFQREPDDFQFCKTAAKPYDVLVTAMLIVSHKRAPDALRISSDGGIEDWADGLALVTARCGEGYRIPMADA